MVFALEVPATGVTGLLNLRGGGVKGTLAKVGVAASRAWGLGWWIMMFNNTAVRC